MKKIISRVVSFAVAGAMIVSLAACGGGAEKATSEEKSTATAASTVSADKVDTSPVTIDWYVDENWYTRAKWGQDLTSQYITKKTGVSLNIIIPQGDNTAKRTAMIASGDLPDVMSMGFWWPEWKQMQKNDMLYSFQELSEKYDPTFFDVTRESLLNYYKSEDGKNYVYPNCTWATEDIPKAKYLIAYPGLTVRSDIYEAIGKPDMSTPDGFLNALKLAQEKFSKIDGQPIIPFLIGSEFVSDGNRGLDDTIMWLMNMPAEKDGKFYKYANRRDAEYLTWLKTLRKAVELKYITLDQFTDKQAQIDQKFKSGRVFATIRAFSSTKTDTGEFYKKDPKTTYIPVHGFMNSGKEAPQLPSNGLSGWLVSMITKDCKNPDRVIKFFHYWLSDEGQSDFWYGDPSMYEEKDGNKVMKQDIYELRSKNEQEFCSKYGGMDNYFMLLNNLTADQGTQVIQPWEQPYYDFQKGRIKDVSETNGNEPDANSPADLEWAKSKAKWGQLLPKMLVSKTDADLEKIMNEYIAFDDKAFAVYGPEMQKKYEAKKKLMGK